MIDGTQFKDKHGVYFTYGDTVLYRGDYYEMLDNTAQRIKIRRLGMRQIRVTTPNMVEVPKEM